MSVQVCDVAAFTRRTSPSLNFGNAEPLRVKADVQTEYPHIYFPLPFPIGAHIVSATLTLHTAVGWSGSNTFRVDRIVGPWAENTLCWSNQPAVSGVNEAVVTVSSPATNQAVNIDVRAMLQDAANGAAWYGFRMSIDEDDIERAFCGDENGNPALRPQLTVVYATLPPAPNRLQPDGGLAVQDQYPTVQWQGSADQQAFQVQVSASSSFASPSYDSGARPGGQQNWALSAAHGFAGLSDGQTIYWRVRIANSAGWSAWSGAAYFQRQTLNTVHIDYPDEGAIDTPRPTVTWSISDTQTRWRLRVWKLSTFLSGGGPPTLVHEAVGSTEQSYAIPAHIIVTHQVQGGDVTEDPQEYMINVESWDAYTRYADAHAIDDTTVFYVRNGTPANVNWIEADEQTGSPELVVRWKRSIDEAPTNFGIRIDGNEVVTDIDPAEAFVENDEDGHPIYQVSFWQLVPRVPHTIEVEAIEFDEGTESFWHSTDNATVTKTIRPVGIWVVDRDDSSAVQILGDDDGDVTIGETATTHTPLGARAAVRILDSVRGYEGSLSGILLSKTARDTFLALRAREKTLVLLFGDLNIPVRIGDARAVPTPAPGDTEFACAFTFFQVGPPWPDGQIPIGQDTGGGSEINF